MSVSVVLKQLRRQFDGVERPAVDDLDLEIEPGETLVLVGPSGCGKSTTLRMVAGLERPDAGTVSIDGKDMTRVPPQQRDVAMVFQGFALYPHMKVRDIIGFPLRMQKVQRAELNKRVAETAEMLGITRLLDRRPDALSGGERQRVAMGRAIVRRPQVFLFDEPLSNLDAALRAELRVELGALLRKLETTAIYVTHDQVEAMTLGSRIALLDQGKLVQCEPPRVMYEQPVTRFVASFFGSPPMNLSQVDVTDGHVQLGTARLPCPSDVDRVEIGIRPEHMTVGPADDGSAELTGKVTAKEALGAESHLTVQVGDMALRVRAPGFDAPGLGSEVQLAVPLGAVQLFDSDTGVRIQ